MSEPKISKAHHGGANHGANGIVTCVVIHDEEYPLADNSAEQIASFFSTPSAKHGCAHYIEDADSEQHVVPDNQIAYHAPPNKGTIGIERDGYASWSQEQWLVPKAQRTTFRVAARTAEICVRFKLPPVWLGVADVKARKKGVTSHNNRSKAFGQSSHSDPGPAFPVNPFMQAVKYAHNIFVDPKRLRDWQGAAGLTPDGDIGPKSISAMTEWLYAGNRFPLAPNKSAPAEAPKPSAPAVDTEKENDVNFDTLYRAEGTQAVFAVTSDGSRVWLDGPWFKALVARKVTSGANIVDLPAGSTVFSLPLKGQSPSA
jgi:hypothetical protein